VPLTTVAQPGTLIEERDGVVFIMNDAGRAVSVLVSRHALEHIDSLDQEDEYIIRFDEYRRQFEEIASDKYDRGLLEQDGMVCIRGRDLPGQGQ
jgi:hypothetical protein